MSLQPIANDPNLYVNGLSMLFFATNSVNVTPGACRDSTNSFDIVVPATLNLSDTSPFFLDKGSFVASTLYHMYVIADQLEFNAPVLICSLSSTGPLLPNGYNCFRRLGSVRTNTGNQFMIFNSTGNGATRNYWYNADVGLLTVLSNGNATSDTPVDISSFVPPSGSGSVNLEYAYSGATVNNVMFLRSYNSNITNYIKIACQNISATIFGIITNFPAGGNPVVYRVTSGSEKAFLYVLGYQDQL